MTDGAGPAGPDFSFSYAANEYGFYCVPDHYRGREIADLLTGGGVYEPATLRFLRRHLGGGDVVTGGAFIGDFIPALRGAMTAGSVLHTFEPVPVSFAAARETIRINGLEGVEIHQVGVGAAASKQPLLVKRSGGAAISAGERVVDEMEVDGNRVIEIDIVTIDSLVPAARTVSLIHLDVEGFEQPALEGAARVIAACRPMVLCEVPKPWKARAILKTLSDAAPGVDYAIMGTIENNAIFVAR